MSPLTDLTPPPTPAADTPTRYHAGDRLPAVLELKDLSAILGLGASRIWDLYEAGEFDFARLMPTIGNKPRFSGKQVQAWIDREPVEVARHFRKGR